MTFREIMANAGYEVQTTFWEDFSIADRFGASAVLDTFNRAFREWKDNHIYLTELVMVLNHKIWQHHDQGDSAMSELYDRLWKEADHYACENLKGEELEYFLRHDQFKRTKCSGKLISAALRLYIICVHFISAYLFYNIPSRLV